MAQLEARGAAVGADGDRDRAVLAGRGPRHGREVLLRLGTPALYLGRSGFGLRGAPSSTARWPSWRLVGPPLGPTVTVTAPSLLDAVPDTAARFSCASALLRCISVARASGFGARRVRRPDGPAGGSWGRRWGRR